MITLANWNGVTPERFETDYMTEALADHDMAVAAGKDGEGITEAFRRQLTDYGAYDPATGAFVGDGE